MRVNWTESRLADLCTRVTVGHVGSMRDQYRENGIPFLRSQNVHPFRIDTAEIKYIDEDFHRKLKKSALTTGDVVVVRTGYPGTAALIPDALPTANCADLVVITPGPELKGRFLVAVFNSAWGKSTVSGRLVGVAQQHFNVTVAKEMRIVHPPIGEQRKIAAALAAYDGLIENNLRQIEILEELAQAVYREWFVNFRYHGREGDELVDSSLGSIPGGWEVGPFSEYANFINGYAFKPSHWENTGKPIVKIRELKNGVTDETPRYHGEDLDEKYHVDTGDLLFSWSADLNAYLWRHGPALLNQHLFNVAPRDGIERAFLFHALVDRMPEFRRRAQGTTMRHIKRAALSEVLVVVPPAEVRRRFVEVVDPMHRLLEVLTAQNANLRATRDLLLPKLVSGEIDVSDLDIDTSWLAA